MDVPVASYFFTREMCSIGGHLNQLGPDAWAPSPSHCSQVVCEFRACWWPQRQPVPGFARWLPRSKLWALEGAK